MNNTKDSGFCLFRSDYWNEKCVRTTLYVPAENYNATTIDDIERELATIIGQELLRRDLLSFGTSWKADEHGDIWVSCQANVLELKDREGKMPSRLRGVKNSRNEAYMKAKETTR